MTTFKLKTWMKGKNGWRILTAFIVDIYLTLLAHFDITKIKDELRKPVISNIDVDKNRGTDCFNI